MSRTLCVRCNTTVYPPERIRISGRDFHKRCFMCTYCSMQLTLSNYRVCESELYCLAHTTPEQRARNEESGSYAASSAEDSGSCAEGSLARVLGIIRASPPAAQRSTAASSAAHSSPASPADAVPAPASTSPEIAAPSAAVPKERLAPYASASVAPSTSASPKLGSAPKAAPKLPSTCAASPSIGAARAPAASSPSGARSSASPATSPAPAAASASPKVSAAPQGQSSSASCSQPVTAAVAASPKSNPPHASSAMPKGSPPRPAGTPPSPKMASPAASRASDPASDRASFVRSELARANELCRAGEYEEGRMILENLLSLDPMPVEAVVALASLSGAAIEGAAHGRAEWRRLADARIAMLLQESFGDEEAGSELKFKFGARAEDDEQDQQQPRVFPQFEHDAFVAPLQNLAAMERSGLKLPPLEKRVQLAAAAALYEDLLPSRRFDAVTTEILYRLGRMYVSGMGIDRSEPALANAADLQAMEYLSVAADKSHAGALYLCGLLASQGRACAYSTIEERCAAHVRAMDALSRAASLGQPAAKRLLAELYAEGRVEGSDNPQLRKEHYVTASNLLAQISAVRSGLLMSLSASPSACAPGFILASQLFTAYLGSHVAMETMRHIVPEYLRLLAVARGFTYPKPQSADDARAALLSLLHTLIYNAPLPSAAEHKNRTPEVLAVEDPSKGAVPRSMNQPVGMARSHLGQYLRGHDERWSVDEVGKVAGDLKDVLDVARTFEKSCEAKAPLEVAEKRLESFAAATQFPHLRACLSVSERPNGAFYTTQSLKALVECAQTLAQQWATLSERSASVFRAIEPPLRSMVEQHELYRYTVNAVDMFPAWRERGFNATVKLSSLARELVRVSGADSQSAMAQHLRSAHAVAQEADEARVSFAEARKLIEQKAAPALADLPASLDRNSLGYDILRNLPTQHRMYTASCRQGRTRRAEQRCRVLLEDGKLEWINPMHRQVGLLLSHRDGDYSLGKLFEKAASFVQAQAAPLAALPEAQPSVDLATLTFDCPWTAYMELDFEEAFRQARQQAQQIAGVAKPPTELYCAVLDEELVERRTTLLRTLTDAQQKTELLHCFARLDAPYNSTASCLLAKQKVLFVLRQLMKERDAFHVAQVILHSIGSRCEDGHSVWVEQLLFSFVVQRAPCDVASGTSEAKTRALQMHVGALMIALRVRFIESHHSPFVRGSSEFDNVEQRTAMSVLLTQALRLPLSLPGRSMPVKYAYFAFKNVEYTDSNFSIEALMERFISGGQVAFKDGAQRVVVPMEGHSLRALGREFRLSCVDTDDMGEARRSLLAAPRGRSHARCANAHEDKIALGEKVPLAEPNSALCSACLLKSDRAPRPPVHFIIPEKLVRAFVEVDPVLGPFWALFQASHYTQSNDFFDSDGAQRFGGNRLRNVLRDIGVLRILEVCGYATVPEGFYRSAPRNWQLPSSQADVSRIDFRVGRIANVSARDDLHEVSIDLGEEEPRTAVTGVCKYIAPETLKNRMVMVVANPKPATTRGVATDVLLLAAYQYEADATRAELIDAPAGSFAGERALLPGVAGQPDDFVDGPTLERVAAHLRTMASGSVAHTLGTFVTHRGPLTSRTLRYAQLH